MPGVGVKYTLRLDDGGRIAVIQHNDGRRELYWFRHAHDDEPRAVITLDDDEARQLGAVIGGAYERPKIVEDLEMALGELTIEWVPVRTRPLDREDARGGRLPGPNRRDGDRDPAGARAGLGRAAAGRRPARGHARHGREGRPTRRSAARSPGEDYRTAVKRPLWAPWRLEYLAARTRRWAVLLRGARAPTRKGLVVRRGDERLRAPQQVPVLVGAPAGRSTPTHRRLPRAGRRRDSRATPAGVEQGSPHSADTYRPARLQPGMEPRPGSRCGRARPRSPACGAALVRRHELHAGHRRREGASRHLQETRRRLAAAWAGVTQPVARGR